LPAAHNVSEFTLEPLQYDPAVQFTGELAPIGQ
jgi:hypothetical protein